MAEVIRDGWALRLTDKWPVKEHVGWIPGPPWPTIEAAEERRRKSGRPEWYEIVPAVMYETGLVEEVSR